MLNYRKPRKICALFSWGFVPLIDFILFFTLRFETLLAFCDADADLIDFLVKCILICCVLES